MIKPNGKMVTCSDGEEALPSFSLKRMDCEGSVITGSQYEHKKCH